MKLIILSAAHQIERSHHSTIEFVMGGEDQIQSIASRFILGNWIFFSIIDSLNAYMVVVEILQLSKLSLKMIRQRRNFTYIYMHN